MANTRELRRRIKSIKNTSQITKAMQMVAAVKMKRAQDQATGGRPYSENLSSALERLLPRVDIEAHPLLVGNESNKTGIILLSTDKGLVGALNTNIMRTVLASPPSTHSTSLSVDPEYTEGSSGNVVFYTVGKKGRSFVVRTGKDLQADFENVDAVTFRQAVQLTKMVVESFKAGEVGQVILIYPQFVSTIKQEPRKVKLLPIDIQSVIASPEGAWQSSESGNSNRSGKIASSTSPPRNDVGGSEFLFEPNADALLDDLLVHHIQIRIYQALLETKASEHSARMVAMKNATDNALDLVEDLQLTYNQTRQSAITNELLEITTAQVAME